MFDRTRFTQPTISSFQKIYKAVLSQDVDAIKQELLDVSINVIGEDGVTVAQKCVMDANYDGFDFLKRNFNVYESEVIHAYAERNELNKVNSLLLFDDRKVQFNALKSAFIGFARGNHYTLMSSFTLLFTMIEKTEQMIFELKFSSAMGFCQKKNNTQLMFLLNNEDDKENKFRLAKRIVYGISLYGDWNTIRGIVDDEWSDTERSALLFHMVYGLAQGYHLGALNMVMEDKQDDVRAELMVAIGTGFAAGGYFELVEFIWPHIEAKEQIRFIETVIIDSIEMGYYAKPLQIIKLLTKLELREAAFRKLAEELVKLERWNNIETLLSLTTTYRETQLVIDLMMDSYDKANNLTAAEQLWQTADTAFKKIATTKKIIYFYAKNNAHEKAQAILNSCETDTDFNTYLIKMMKGYLSIRNFKAISEFLNTFSMGDEREKVLSGILSAFDSTHEALIFDLIELGTSVDERLFLIKNLILKFIDNNSKITSYMILFVAVDSSNLYEATYKLAAYHVAKVNSDSLLKLVMSSYKGKDIKFLYVEAIKGFVDGDYIDQAKNIHKQLSQQYQKSKFDIGALLGDRNRLFSKRANNASKSGTVTHKVRFTI